MSRASELTIHCLLVLVGVTNLLPVVGVVSRRVVGKLYGIEVSSNAPDLAILLRHRAVLFGLIGGVQVLAAWVPAYRAAALVSGLVSMLSFVILAQTTKGHGLPIRKVVVVDVVASLALVAVAGLM